MRHNKQNNALVVVLVVLFSILLFGGFGMIGFGRMGMYGMMGYGNNYLCSNVGGIWCYIPIFGLLFMILFWVVVALLVVWIVRQLQNRGRK